MALFSYVGSISWCSLYIGLIVFFNKLTLTIWKDNCWLIQANIFHNLLSNRKNFSLFTFICKISLKRFSLTLLQFSILLGKGKMSVFREVRDIIPVVINWWLRLIDMLYYMFERKETMFHCKIGIGKARILDHHSFMWPR